MSEDSKIKKKANSQYAEFFFANPTELKSAVERIKNNAQQQPNNNESNSMGCIITSYSSKCETPSGKKKSTSAYPVIGVKHGKGSRVSMSVPCHMVIAIDKQIKKGVTEMWDTNEYQVSHECHNKQCVNPDHIEVIPTVQNREKSNMSCVGKVECPVCNVNFLICPHPTKCLTVVRTLCSICLTAALSSAYQ